MYPERMREKSMQWRANNRARYLGGRVRYYVKKHYGGFFEAELMLRQLNKALQDEQNENKDD
jgi:hypothetical protein